MIKSNLHTHTIYCDGSDAPEDMVLTAIDKGFSVLGFSGHGPDKCSGDCCMTREKAAEYRDEIARLKAKYLGVITILCGVEQDYWYDEPAVGYDYIIGSVHAIKIGGEYVAVDWTVDKLKDGVAKYWNGDWYSMIEEYYGLMGDIVCRTRADIIGHFDLVTKFNEGGVLFDEHNPRYIKAAHRAALELIKTNRPFEINTGAIARGYRTTPFPSRELAVYIKEHGGRFILTSDCHKKEYLDCGFETIGREWRDLLE